jgi:LacI family transcriptional regulator, galactose operon repressor
VARATLRKVAEMAGVHVSTASRALDPGTESRVNSATVVRVKAVAEQLGYRRHMIASGLKRGRTSTVGVAVADLGHPFVSTVLRGIENVLEPNRFMTVIAETQDDDLSLQRTLEHFASRRVDAVITTAARLSNAEELIRFASDEMPVVLAVRRLPGSGLPTVRIDDRLGGELVAGFLMQLGHRRIAQLPGPHDIQPFLDRAAGLQETVEAMGGEIVPLRALCKHPTYEEGQRLMGQLLGSGATTPTAVFAHNDPIAIGALDVIKRSGLRCPEDISIVGYNDNQYVEHLSPPLTTVRIHSYEMGRAAAEMALQVITTSERPEDIVLPPQLVPRGSTKRNQVREAT